MTILSNSKMNKYSKLLARSGIAACAILMAANFPASHRAEAQSLVEQPTKQLSLSIGEGQLITLASDMSDVFVANDNIADVQVRSTRQIYIFGKAGGETSFYVTNKAGNVLFSANVRVGSNINSIDQMLNMALPGAKIAVSTMNGLVLLTGTVASPANSAEARDLVQAYVGEETKVVSRLRTQTPMQVNLQVRIAEVSRSLSREIGTNLASRDTTGGFLSGISRSSRENAITIGNRDTSGLPLLDASGQIGLPPGSLELPFDPATGQFVVGGTNYTFAAPKEGNTLIKLAGMLFGLDVAAAFDLGERHGLISTLSQPNATVISGETSDFLAGGEFPVPVSQGFGTTTIEYRKYGVSLVYSPVVLSNGRIVLNIDTEVSELSFSGAVQLNGFQVPALSVRRAKTTVELGSGQSFMIAGLLSNNSQNSLQKAPGLADVPILGNLFKSSDFQRGETELVIMITPYLVEPVSDNDIVLPTDGYQTPNEAERLLLNRQAGGHSGDDRYKPSVQPSSPSIPAQPALGPVGQTGSNNGQPKGDKAVTTGQKARVENEAAPSFSFEG